MSESKQTMLTHAGGEESTPPIDGAATVSDAPRPLDPERTVWKKDHRPGAFHLTEECSAAQRAASLTPMTVAEAREEGLTVCNQSACLGHHPDPPKSLSTAARVKTLSGDAEVTVDYTRANASTFRHFTPTPTPPPSSLRTETVGGDSSEDEDAPAPETGGEDAPEADVSAADDEVAAEDIPDDQDVWASPSSSSSERYHLSVECQWVAPDRFEMRPKGTCERRGLSLCTAKHCGNTRERSGSSNSNDWRNLVGKAVEADGGAEVSDRD